MSIEIDEEIKSWTALRKSALVLDIIQGKTTVSEPSCQFDLPPSEIEYWIDQAKAGMENALKATQAGIKTRFISAADLLLQLGTARSRGHLQEYMARAVLDPKLLVVDQLGYLPFGREEANLFFQVVAHRHERSSTIIMSNLPFAQWATALADDTTLTAAPLDRLLHHAHIVQISGESYRMKDKQRAGTPPRSREISRESRLTRWADAYLDQTT